MKIALLILLSGLALPGAQARADEQTRRAQEELRKRNLYFGEVDGQAGEEVSSAIRRYQQRKGLAVSGTLTAETLRALNLPTGGAAVEWPNVAVMRSDSPRAIPPEVKEALEKNATGEPPPIAEGEEPAPAEAVPPADPSPRAPAESPAPAKEAPPPDLATAMREYIQSYLRACEEHSPASELEFYGASVDYFDQGNVNHGFIARDVKHFYDRWPERHYDLLDCKVTRIHGADRDVTFTIAFKYDSEHGRVAGRSANYFTVRADEPRSHIVGMKERRLRN
jgi:peptidoglycan hydrolase-like protein with peptidoglycan-binding domain